MAPLTGQTDQHLCTTKVTDALGARLHRDVTAPFFQLQAAARDAGFDLRILSGFRSFEKQLSIWNCKVAGELAVLDSDSVPIDTQALSEEELVVAILRWSALPGASRHHWGTDVDVYDAAAQPEGYEIRLVPEEVEAGGMFGPLHQWLDDRIRSNAAFDFFRPYDQDRQGVAPERWHLSHGPVASRFEQELTVDVLREAIQTADMALKDVVLEDLHTLYERFATNTSRPLT